MGEKIHLGKTVTPFDSIGESKAIDRTVSYFDSANEKRLINKGKYDENVAKQITGTLKLMFSGMLENVTTEEQTAHLPYKGIKNIEFQILLRPNYDTSCNSFHICFPIKIKKWQT